MASQSGNFDFNAGAGIDFTDFVLQPAAYNDLKGTGEGNTSPVFFFGDEGIDTTNASFEPSFDAMFAPVSDMNNSTAFGMEPLGLDNTTGSASWFPTTPAQSFESPYTPQFNSLGKRPLQLDVQQGFPQAKRHEAFSPFTTSASITGSSNWGLDTQATPASSEFGLSDEAADVCATWFSKYNVLPSDKHIDSLSQLTGESSTAIRQWFGQALKQGMTGQDSAYKSQTGFTQDPLFNQISHATGIVQQPLTISDVSCNHDIQAGTATVSSPLRGGKKGCNPTNDPELLKRDPNKIYQCTRKCGKRYGRKCDWKRNEEEGYPSKSWLCSLCVSEGVERVKPCFRKYHFSQHFRNIHPGLNSADYEEPSVVHSDTSLPTAAQRCGFCTHRFVSRQDRIDHIAEHFKNGKCMLDWNEDEANDSDDMNDDDDNDDDRPDSGGFGNGKPFFPPHHDPRGSGSGPKDNGNGGPQPPKSGFYQFRLSQLADSETEGASSGVPRAEQDIMSKQHIKPVPRSDGATCNNSSQDNLSTTTTTWGETCGNVRSLHGRLDEAKGDNPEPLAGDVVPLLDSQLVQLSPVSLYVPPSDGDPAPSESPRAPTPSSNGSLCRELLGSLKLLGAGGFSTVDEVVHRETSLRFARKTLKNRERSALNEFKNEVDVLQKLRHPHIIRFVDSFQNGDRMSILLSPVADTTLDAWLDTSVKNRPEGLSQTIVKMLGCLASSIRYLHEQRPVVKHMDIKPQNILVKQDQEFPHVILSDFGVSSMGELTANGKTKPLTRLYCAPEVSEGTSRDLASDIWSLGCVYLEMLAVAFKEDNPRWQDFREQFGGHKGKFYWQDVAKLQDLLTQSLEYAVTHSEVNATRTVKQMLSAEPTDRLTAPKLAMVFTPAPCCLSWPNEKVAYPGPSEELQTVKTVIQEDGGDDCAHLYIIDAQQKPQTSTGSHAKRWLEECSHDHEACRDQLPSLTNKTLPTRLLDILPDGQEGLSIRLVSGADLHDSENLEYVAVSHVWADTDVTLSTNRLAAMQSALLKEALPKALNEAIAKAQVIGFRYIWVDSLCVLQDSEEDKERECHATADVYRNAALTIVLDQLTFHDSSRDAITNSGEDVSSAGIQDIARRPDLQLAATLPALTFLTPGFAWDTRAWSLQERLLSRRFLHLGREQMYWECNTLKASETFPRGLTSFRHTLSSLFWEKVHTRASSSLHGTQGHTRGDRHAHFDGEGRTSTDVGGEGRVTKSNANGKGKKCAYALKGYGKPSTPHGEDVLPCDEHSKLHGDIPPRGENVTPQGEDTRPRCEDATPQGTTDKGISSRAQGIRVDGGMKGME